jgi:hypothetical protein
MVEETDEALVIPAPVLVEVDYRIRPRLYADIMVALLDGIVGGAFTVEERRVEDWQRIREVCDRYADSDIGFVDAAVLAVTERLGEPKLAGFFSAVASLSPPFLLVWHTYEGVVLVALSVSVRTWRSRPNSSRRFTAASARPTPATLQLPRKRKPSSTDSARIALSGQGDD